MFAHLVHQFFVWNVEIRKGTNLEREVHIVQNAEKKYCNKYLFHDFFDGGFAKYQTILFIAARKIIMSPGKTL